MKKISILLIVLTLVMMVGCSRSNTETANKPSHSKPLNGEANILQSWQGDFPVAQLKLLPDKQREQAVGFITDAKTFETVWKAW